MQAQQRMRPVDDVANVASLALPLQSQDTEVNDPGSALSPSVHAAPIDEL